MFCMIVTFPNYLHLQRSYLLLDQYDFCCLSSKSMGRSYLYYLILLLFSYCIESKYTYSWGQEILGKALRTAKFL